MRSGSVESDGWMPDGVGRVDVRARALRDDVDAGMRGLPRGDARGQRRVHAFSRSVSVFCAFWRALVQLLRPCT
jgi:hypothetical protein